MARNNRRPSPTGQRAQELRAQIAAAETSSTGTNDDLDLGPMSSSPSPKPGQKVAVPSQALMGSDQPTHDWGKYGFFLAGFLAVVAVIWQFADTTFAVKSMGEDVKVLQRKSDDLYRVSVDVTARISAVERVNPNPKQAPTKPKEPQKTN
jgi:hypothetical protein